LEDRAKAFESSVKGLIVQLAGFRAEGSLGVKIYDAFRAARDDRAGKGAEVVGPGLKGLLVGFYGGWILLGDLPSNSSA
jgi:hypothetical protein